MSKKETQKETSPVDKEIQEKPTAVSEEKSFSRKGFIALNGKVMWKSPQKVNSDGEPVEVSLSAFGKPAVRANSIPKILEPVVQRALDVGTLIRVDKKEDVNVSTPVETKAKDIVPSKKGHMNLGNLSTRAEYNELEKAAVRNNKRIPKGASFHKGTLAPRDSKVFDLLQNTTDKAIEVINTYFHNKTDKTQITNELQELILYEKRGWNTKGGPRLAVMECLNRIAIDKEVATAKNVVTQTKNGKVSRVSTAMFTEGTDEKEDDVQSQFKLIINAAG